MLQCYIEFLPTHEVEVGEDRQDGDSEMQSVHFSTDGAVRANDAFLDSDRSFASEPSVAPFRFGTFSFLDSIALHARVAFMWNERDSGRPHSNQAVGTK